MAAEGASNRRIQLGVAKKIKNGARKVVLEKAEEARVAAFSAFQSLGLSVPQFSCPLLSNSGNLVEVGAISAGVLHQRDHASHKFCKESSKNAGQRSFYDEGDKVVKTLEGSLDAATEKSSACPLNCSLGVDNPTIPVQKMLTISSEPDAANDHNRNPDVITSAQLGQNGDGTSKIDSNSNNPVQGKSVGQGICVDNRDSVCEKGPINAYKFSGGIDCFLDLLATVKEFFFDIHYNKQSEVNSVITFEVHGMAICWENSPVYYVNLPKDLLSMEDKGSEYVCVSGSVTKCTKPEIWSEMVRHRWERISDIMGKAEVRKITWNMKLQAQVLMQAVVSIQRACNLKFSAKFLDFEHLDNSHLSLPPVSIKGGVDMCIVAWMLWPDEERSSSPNLEKEAKKRLSMEALATANRSGRWKNQMRRAAHNGCCRRVAQTRALYSVLWKLLISEGLVEALEHIEIPLINVLAEMELCGIGVDMEGCLQARNVLGKKLKSLEKEAYKLAGMTFSLYTAVDIANVLYGHLKLPIPEGLNKGKQHPSTAKECLDLLRNEHPIVPVIREHRTLAKLLHSTLGSVCSLARHCMRTQKYTLHGHWLQTSTATGRLSMEAPNLQCVEHMVDFMISNGSGGVDGDSVCHKINARDFFVPTQEEWLLLTADYSQIELRLMAHFSRDVSLIELLCEPFGDVFNMIAAKWTGKHEESVAVEERDQTKRLVYGILYGMSAKTLARQLHCSSDEATEKIKTFKSTFPGVASWLHDAVASCHEKGFVETLKGRKRFLSKIKFGNSKEKAKAQRQAVNSICQGSAADIIKIAMINIHSVITGGFDRTGSSTSPETSFPMLKGRCRMVLQVHDELVLEVDSSVIKEAAVLLKTSMESAAKLLVPLQVKLKVGRTWGSLEPVQFDHHTNEVLAPD